MSDAVVICTRGDPPTWTGLLAHLRERGVSVVVDEEVAPSESDLDWTALRVSTTPASVGPIVVAIERFGSIDFLERLDMLTTFIPSEDSEPVERVRTALKLARFFVTVDVPWLGADGYETVTDLVSFFVENNDALIYVVGGGFFDRNELLVSDD